MGLDVLEESLEELRQVPARLALREEDLYVPWLSSHRRAVLGSCLRDRSRQRGSVRCGNLRDLGHDGLREGPLLHLLQNEHHDHDSLGTRHLLLVVA
eukprot:6491044-Amphidinium_carterae.2